MDEDENHGGYERKSLVVLNIDGVVEQVMSELVR